MKNKGLFQIEFWFSHCSVLNEVTIALHPFSPFPSDLCHSDIYLWHFCVDLGSLLQDGWVGFKAVLLNKRLTAADFYNGYLHHTVKRGTPHQTAEGLFVSGKGVTEADQS